MSDELPEVSPVIDDWAKADNDAKVRRSNAGCILIITGVSMAIVGAAWGAWQYEKWEKAEAVRKKQIEPAGAHEIRMMGHMLDYGPDGIDKAITDAMQDGTVTMGEYEAICKEEVRLQALEFQAKIKANAEWDEAKARMEAGDPLLTPSPD